MKKVILFSPTGYVGGRIKEVLKKESNLQLYEITRTSNLEQYQTEYDILIYSASVTSARHEMVDRYIQDNVVTAVSMIDFCRKHAIKRIIYLSSDEIYGEISTDMVTEKAVMVNPNLYATTKYLAEKIIIESGIPYYILRLPGIVGRAWGKSFVYSLMDKIKNNEQVELYNLDRKFNNIVDIDDLTSFINILCHSRDYGKNEIFLLGNTESIILKEVVCYIKHLYQSTSHISNVDTVYKRYFTLDVSKAVEYGYSSKKIKTIISELYQIQKGLYRPQGKKYLHVNENHALKLDKEYISYLKSLAQENEDKKCTMCLHNDIRAHVHEMINVYPEGAYIRPHSHPLKTETKIIIEGKLLVVIFHDNGEIADRFIMEKDGVFTFRMDRGMIHTNIPLTNVVFYEVTEGPFTGIDDSIYPEWAPLSNDDENVAHLMDKIGAKCESVSRYDI